MKWHLRLLQDNESDQPIQRADQTRSANYPAAGLTREVLSLLAAESRIQPRRQGQPVERTTSFDERTEEPDMCQNSV